MSEDKRQEAMEIVGKAYQLHMKGDVDQAIELYTESLDLEPTAEAFTFRGWALSYNRDFDGAIADCHRAIDLDPEFGNPYNDIGAYYIELGQPDDAIPWLKMALKAKRYESYCFRRTRTRCRPTPASSGAWMASSARPMRSPTCRSSWSRSPAPAAIATSCCARRPTSPRSSS